MMIFIISSASEREGNLLVDNIIPKTLNPEPFFTIALALFHVLILYFQMLCFPAARRASLGNNDGVSNCARHSLRTKNKFIHSLNVSLRVSHTLASACRGIALVHRFGGDVLDV